MYIYIYMYILYVCIYIYICQINTRSSLGWLETKRAQVTFQYLLNSLTCFIVPGMLRYVKVT